MDPKPIADIRRDYPAPTMPPTARAALPQEYCVGGAVCMAHGLDLGTDGDRQFPEPHTLARALETINPALSEADASCMADLITGANDRGEFERAWDYADEALRFPDRPIAGRYR